MSTSTLSDLIDELARGLPPARLRVLCSEPLRGALPPGMAVDWPGLEGAGIAAAACGVAAAERPRGGRVLAIASEPGSGVFAEAGALAAQLGLDNLHLLLAGDEPGLLVRLGLGKPGAWVQDGTRQIALGSGAEPPRATLRQEWPPIHLASLPIDGTPPWPSGASSPLGAARAALAWLAAREARVLLPHADPAWAAAPDGATKTLAAAHLCSEGRRVAWIAGPRVAGELTTLREIGRRGLALKLLCRARDLPPLGALEGWWVAMPGDAAETSAVLAHALAGEEPFLIALPDDAGSTPSAAGPWMPGSGRRLDAGSAARATIACAADGASAALAAAATLRAQGVEVAVLQCTSLMPPPLPELERARVAGPLIVVDTASLGALIGRWLPCRVVEAIPGRVWPDADGIAAAVREALG